MMDEDLLNDSWTSAPTALEDHAKTLTFASCLLLVQCTVLRQECQHETELDTESLLRSVQDNVSHVVTRLLRLTHECSEAQLGFTPS